MCHLSLLSSLGLVVAPSIRRCNYDPFLTFPENHRWFPRGLVRTHCRNFPFYQRSLGKPASSSSSRFTTALNRHVHPHQAICVLHVQPVAHPGGFHRSPPPTPRADSPSPLPRELLPSLCLQDPRPSHSCPNRVRGQRGQRADRKRSRFEFANAPAANQHWAHFRADYYWRGGRGGMGTGAGREGRLGYSMDWVGSRLHWLR